MKDAHEYYYEAELERNHGQTQYLPIGPSFNVSRRFGRDAGFSLHRCCQLDEPSISIKEEIRFPRDSSQLLMDCVPMALAALRIISHMP